MLIYLWLRITKGRTVRTIPFKSCISALVLVLTPLFAQAAGLGKLALLSSLGQPLSAEIELVSVQKDEAGSLAVRLASPDAYTCRRGTGCSRGACQCAAPERCHCTCTCSGDRQQTCRQSARTVRDFRRGTGGSKPPIRPGQAW